MSTELNIECVPATYEALQAILTHEGIPYTTAVGSNLVVVISRTQLSRVNELLKQWASATASLVSTTEYLRRHYEDKDRTQNQA